VVNAFDCLSDATGNGGGISLKAASWIVDDSERQYSQSDIEVKANRDKVVPIGEERLCVKRMSSDQSGSTEIVKSESAAVHIRSDKSSLEDKFCSLEKELRDIRHLLEVTKSKVPNSIAGPANTHAPSMPQLR
jgi:hypothetical protein